MTAPLAKVTIPTSHADMANAIRFLAADAVEKAKSGHPGMPMGMADVATVLFSRFLKFDAKAPRWADRDRFVLSAGHGSMLLYALAYLTGYDDVDVDQLKQFRQLGARTAGHPEYGHVAIAETTTGPLGQGIANAVGFALAEKIQAARFGSDVVDHRTYVIARRRLPDGGDQPGGDLAGRSPQTRQTDRLVGRQRNLHRREDQPVAKRRPTGPFRRQPLECEQRRRS